MCVVSMIAEHYNDKWRISPKPFEWGETPKPLPKFPTKEELDDFWRLYERAKEYDRKNHEPDCETKEKMDNLVKLAKELGVGDEVKKILDGTYKP